MSKENQSARSSALISPLLDFWLLGGLSIALWVVMMLAEWTRSESLFVSQHLIQVIPTFGLLAIFCNHPHFLISYRFGYGRGGAFVKKHYFSLIIVPLLMLLVFAAAFFNFHALFHDSYWVSRLNHFFVIAGFSFQFGSQLNLGSELLSLSVWAMYFTVGWHYSKQVFGCMMVYAHYDHYVLTHFQRRLIKSSVFSVAFYNFIYINSTSVVGQFFNVQLSPLGIPVFFEWISRAVVCLLTISVVVGVFYSNYRKNHTKPSLNFLIPWIAFYIWWIPVIYQQEYYFIMVPFFHSLQYLPFAYRIEERKGDIESGRYHFTIGLKMVLLVIVGFLSFELLPNILDNYLDTEHFQIARFFTISAIVFINIHHFFIDSVVWRLQEVEPKRSLLFER